MRPSPFPSVPAAMLISLSWLPTILGASEDAARHFDTVIAPIFSRHCLECHDSAHREGKLDLSKRSEAFSSGKKDPVIVPGSTAKSRLWDSVEHDSMPEDRPPLSDTEKAALRDWIEAGAVWPGEEIDPLAHLRAGGESTSLPRRLTREEYLLTVRATTGVEIRDDALRLLPPDERAEGFTNTAYHLKVDLTHVQAYADLARLIADRLDPTPFLALDDRSVESLVDHAAERLLGGPLPAEERALYVDLARETTHSDAESAARLIVEAMVQSPRFLYRIERQRGDGRPRPVTPHEFATRLSYLVWGVPPDEKLRHAAKSGALDSETEIAAQVDRLLADPRAIERSLRFARDWLDLDRLDALRPGAEKFPDWSPDLSADLKAETLAYFRAVVWEDKLPLARLHNAPFTFVTPRLARHYGLPEDSDAGPAPLLDYRFGASSTDLIANRGSLGESFSLRIDQPGATEAEKHRALRLRKPTSLTPGGPAKPLVAALQKSREFTVSLRFTPANTHQKGPARILTISRGTGERNLTIGQEGDRFEVRLRAEGTGRNGDIDWQTKAGTAHTRPTHLLLVREKSGRTRLYLDGREAASRDLPGDLGNWSGDHRLVFGNETDGKRPWLGTLHEAAVFDRALTPGKLPETLPEWRRVDLTSLPSRGGLLTHGSLLSIGGDDASMVTRGLFVLQEVLGGGVTSAPPGTDTTPIPPQPGQSRRGVSETRMSKSECGGCHAKFEPLAFGLEKFDALGAWNEKDEHGNVQREDGEILFPGAAEPVAYGSVDELLDLLADSDRVARAITRKVTQFAVGRPLGNADAAVLDSIHQRASADGGTWQALIKAIALSDLTRLTPTEPQS